MTLKEVWIKANKLTKTAMILSGLCFAASIVNIFFRSIEVNVIIDKGLILILMLDFIALLFCNTKTEKELLLSESRRRALMFMHNRVETRLLNAEKKSWNALEIQSVFLEERERYLKEIKD